jgi:type IV secretion system protein VirD4
MATCNRWFRLFVNLTLEAMERERTKPKIPVLAVLEEFHVLGYMQQVEVAAGLAAGFGMKLLIVLQDLTQLKRHYKDGWETFLGNAGVLVFFGNNDMTTLDYVSKRCGQTSLIVERKADLTVDQKTAGQTGLSWSLEVRELLTPEEASRFFARDDKHQRQLLIHPGLPPVVIQRVKYDQHESFKGKFDPPE